MERFPHTAGQALKGGTAWPMGRCHSLVKNTESSYGTLKTWTWSAGGYVGAEEEKAEEFRHFKRDLNVSFILQSSKKKEIRYILNAIILNYLSNAHTQTTPEKHT
jgi:hypothetical protein